MRFGYKENRNIKNHVLIMHPMATFKIFNRRGKSVTYCIDMLLRKLILKIDCNIVYFGNNIKGFWIASETWSSEIE